VSFDYELEVARRVAQGAGEIALEHGARGVTADQKADDSPVTAADRACEAFIASSLREAFPDDGLLGEEGARHAGRSGRRWIIDPIDGTRDFLRGIPVWSTLLALEADGEVVVGVCHFAALGETYWAARGHGAWMTRRRHPHEPGGGEDARRLRVSSIDRRDRAVVCLSTLNGLAGHALKDRTLDYLATAWAVRSISGCFEAMLVASGRAEAWIELSAASWDLAALQVIAEEAGARFFNFDGGRSVHGGNCVICAPGFEGELRALVGSGNGDPLAPGR
jgi:histidinol phosphatase-like enzyme (inositol monophosphatase family)